MIDNTQLMLGGVALMPIIVAVVELFKKFGLPTSWCPWITALLSALCYGLVVWLGTKPEYLATVQTGLTILVIFLGATGFYNRAIVPYFKTKPEVSCSSG